VCIQDRPYYGQQQPYGSGGFGIRLPRLTPVVKYLLIINIAVFLLQLISGRALMDLFAASGQSQRTALEVWRLITFQFLHSQERPFHLLYNMIGLYFLGPMLERSWGGRHFLVFYLICGAVGGGAYVIASAIGVFRDAPLIGASGGVLALLVACAVLFPHVRVILFLFPMQIRTAAVLLAAGFFLIVVAKSYNAGGNLCHLGGMATGFIWVMARPYFAGRRQNQRRVVSQRRQHRQIRQDSEVDRILAKVHGQGIHSLTRHEKEVLRHATEEQKRQGRN